MLPTISYRIIDRGPTPRNMAKAYRAAAKESWQETGVHFVTDHTERRFTHKHGTAAGYKPRTEKYQKRKLKLFGHTYPMEFTGQTRQRVRTGRVTSTSTGNRVSFPQARRLNMVNRNARDPINLRWEFTRVPQYEADELATHFDSQLDQNLAKQQTTQTTVHA